MFKVNNKSIENIEVTIENIEVKTDTQFYQNLKAIYHQTKNSLRYFVSVIWNSLPTEIREDHSISSFVTKIKQWKPIACPYTICKSYIGRVGYINVSDY